MMGFKLDTHRENCGQCTKQVYVGQSSIVCSSCDMIFHSNCVKHTTTIFRQNIYCSICIDKYDIIRYNPYFNFQELDNDKFYDNEPTDYIDIMNDMSDILENCKNIQLRR